MMPIYGIELCDEKIVHISGVGNHILNGLRLEILNVEQKVVLHVACCKIKGIDQQHGPND